MYTCWAEAPLFLMLKVSNFIFRGWLAEIILVSANLVASTLYWCSNLTIYSKVPGEIDRFNFIIKVIPVKWIRKSMCYNELQLVQLSPIEFYLQRLLRPVTPRNLHRWMLWHPWREYKLSFCWIHVRYAAGFYKPREHSEYDNFFSFFTFWHAESWFR